MAAPEFAWMPLSAFTDRRLGARDLRILGVLYAHAGSDRVCWPAVATLAELTGIDRRDVQRTIRRLEDFGWVRVEAGGGRASTSRYRLWTAPPSDGPVTAGDVPADNDERAGDATAGESPQMAGDIPTDLPERAGDSPPKGRVTCHETAGDPPARTYQNKPVNRVNPSCASPTASASQDESRARPTAESSKAARMEDFAAFWSAYPRRRGKADALKVWRALKPDAALVEQILAALAFARASPDWRREGGQFIPYPATWLRRRGWEDELEPDIEPLPQAHTASHGEARRINGTLVALDSLFGGGRADAQHDVSEGHGIPLGRVWH
ncbi:helix-turn-helix domain-containing protein [Halomonas mongoliensis]|uniref:helix-turn-helix domain-containing protein n=1 Tax=Halomonas mongoliensis TaxID=321265 RepID=UPI00403ACC85